MKRSWREWQRKRGKEAVDAFLERRPIRVFDRYGRQIGERIEINCDECGHWAVIVVPVDRSPRFRCSECGALARPVHEAA